MQSDLLPSACMVELPSNPHSGRSARVGAFSNDFIRVLPRNSGMGCLAVKPDILEFVFCHILLTLVGWPARCAGKNLICKWINPNERLKYA